MQSKTYTITQDDKTVMSITITAPDGVVYNDIEWDSRTGLVTAKVGSSTARTPIPYTGNSLGAINPGPFTITNATDISYHYWYY